MSGPLMYLGMWDARRDSRTLYADVAAALERDGARLDPATVAVWDHEHFSPAGEAGDLDYLEPNNGEGGLVQLDWSTGSVEGGGTAAWRRLNDAVAALVLAVRPTLATVSDEWPADGYLPDPDWDDASHLFWEGWVDLAGLTPQRRARFEELARRGLAAPLGPGLWWTANKPEVGPVELPRPLPLDPRRHPDYALAAEVYHAWTGRTAPEPEDTGPPVPLRFGRTTDLWFWSTDREQTQRRVFELLAPRGYESIYVDEGIEDDRWRPIMAVHELGFDQPVPNALADLRDVVAAAPMAWAALHRNNGMVLPGYAPSDDIVSGQVEHPWVSLDWIGADLPRLDAALAGCHREELAGGVLYVTDPALAPDTEFGPGWDDKDTRMARITAAAVILGVAQRRGIGLPPDNTEWGAVPL